MGGFNVDLLKLNSHSHSNNSLSSNFFTPFILQLFYNYQLMHSKALIDNKKISL